jgi:hypothetical protein
MPVKNKNLAVLRAFAYAPKDNVRAEISSRLVHFLVLEFYDDF